MKKLHSSLIGFLQALGVVAYCAAFAGSLQVFGKIFTAPPGFLGSVLMLVLLVFSAAVTGSIVFGYSAYLALKNQIKEALSVLAFTLLYCLGIIMLIVFAISL